MKNELEMVLRSRKSLTDLVARQQISALSDFCGGLMRPDKCGEVEPVRTPFDPADISKPIEWLAQPFGEFFYQKDRPIHVSGEMWNLDRGPDSRFPSPLFTNKWTGHFHGKWANQVGIEKIEAFVCEMFRVTASDFGLLTTRVDLEAKNTLPPVVSYKGLDPASGIPGLYWINLFSDQYAGWLGLNDLPGQLATQQKLAGGAVLLRFCESPNDCRSFDVLQKQRVAMEWLGPEKFFDVRLPERKAPTPDWDRIPIPGTE